MLDDSPTLPLQGKVKKARYRHVAQLPDSFRSLAPFSGERLITEAQPTSLALARNALASTALNSIGAMPALDCRSRSDLISASFSLSSPSSQTAASLSTFFCLSLSPFQTSRLTNTPT